ncbi:MAG: SagB/ThcOx family dehydrogenase [Candidatus Hodarchaeota archaeon]
MENEPKVIPLPAPDFNRDFSLVHALQQRRSIRSFQKDQKLAPDELSNLLWAAQGLIPRNGKFPPEQQDGLSYPPFRTAPSGGGYYSLVLYVVTREGVYLYLPEEHALVLYSENDLVDTLADTFRIPFLQDAVRSASATILFASDVEKATRWASSALDAVGAPYMETGAAAQNLMLMATAMGLGTVLMQNFDPWHCAQHLKLPLRHALICAVLVGYKMPSHSESNE